MRRAMNRRVTGKRSSRPGGRGDRRRPGPKQPTLFENPLPSAPTGTYPTTVYRLDVAPDMDGMVEALNADYLRDNGFTPLAREVAGAPALLVLGTVPRPRAEWCDVLAGLTGEDVQLGYASGGGALLLVVDGRVYALTYGTLGRHMVEHEKIDRTFGIAFAVRALVPDDIRQVRRRVVGVAGRVDRNLVPGGQPIRMYGIDKWGEIVGQVCGTTHNLRLAACRRTGRPVRVAGGDALHIHLSVDPEGLLADLREIDRVCQQVTPLADLEFIMQIRPLPPSDPRIPALADTLDQRLGQPGPDGLGIAVPGALVADIEQVGSYRIHVPKSGQAATVTPELDLATVLSHTNGALDGDRWTGLRNGKVTLCTDAAGIEELHTTALSRWLTAEVAIDTTHLLLHEGGWYEIGDRHREFLRQEIAEILTRSSSIVLPPWSSTLPDEDAYNKEAVRINPSLVLLDKKLLRTVQHRRGIEACDLLGPDGELIHVKRAASSSPLSHLFAQGVTSFDALRYEEEARRKLIDLVRQQPNGRHLDPDYRPRKVVYGIALKDGRPLTVDTLFTFAQVALYRAMKTLRAEGIEVEVVTIPSA
ncbi:DUF6119 family protein [Micromonospora coxensis]|uniref:DUF6119 family protein n=1 Tax=Micromonospora coxensis TaxID=356852 RepID=UPI00341656EA